MTLRTGHPRIWLTPTTLARVKARVAAGSDRWLAVKAQADKAASWDVRPITYALAYQATGNPTYADRAIQLASVFINQWVGAITGDSGFPCRQVLPEEAIVYDWCYDRLSSSQRATWRSAMEAQGNWVWPSTNPSRNGAWGLWSGSNYNHGFMMTWLVGLAIGDESSIGRTLLNQAVSRWQNETLPHLKKYWTGGYLGEGSNYGVGSLYSMAQYLTAHLTATDDPLSTLLPSDWYPALLKAMIHLTTPNRARLYPGGDQARISSAPLSAYSRTPVLALMNFVDNETAGMARYWLDTITPSRNDFSFLKWAELLWYRDDLPAVDYTAKISRYYFMPGQQLASSRTSWQNDATQVVFSCGLLEEAAHQDRGAGHFQIWKGDWLIGAAKIWSHDGTFHDSPYLNVLQIDGQNQDADQDGNTIIFQQDTETSTTWVGDATAAYSASLTSYRRHLLWIKPNWLIVMDRVVAKNPLSLKKWLLHVQNEPILNGFVFQSTSGSNRLFGRSLLPSGATVRSEAINLGTEGARSSSRVSITAPTGQAETYFLTALEITTAAQTLPSALQFSQVGNKITLSFAGKTVNAFLDGTVPGLTLLGDVPPPPSPYPPAKPVLVTLTPATGKAGVIVEATGTGFGGAPTVGYSVNGGSRTLTPGETSDQRVSFVAPNEIVTGPIWIVRGEDGVVSNPLPFTVPVGIPVQPLLVDGFEDGQPGVWTAGSLTCQIFSGASALDPKVTVVEANGILTITPRGGASGEHYNGYVSRQGYDATGASVSVEVPQVTTGSAADTTLALARDPQNYIFLQIEGSNLWCEIVTGGTRSQSRVPYNATQQRFWQISHNAVTKQWSFLVSGDANTWRVLRMVSETFPVTALRAELSAGTWDVVKSPGKAIFDNFKWVRE